MSRTRPLRPAQLAVLRRARQSALTERRERRHRTWVSLLPLAVRPSQSRRSTILGSLVSRGPRVCPQPLRPGRLQRQPPALEVFVWWQCGLHGALPQARERPAAPDRARSARPGRHAPPQSDREQLPRARHQFAARSACDACVLRAIRAWRPGCPEVVAPAEKPSSGPAVETVEPVEAAEACASGWPSSRAGPGPQDNLDRSPERRRLPSAPAQYRRLRVRRGPISDEAGAPASDRLSPRAEGMQGRFQIGVRLGYSSFRATGPKTHAMKMLRMYRPTIGSARIDWL